MDLNKLPKIKQKAKKRLGRGESSGKGKTSSRGAKGQKKRENVKVGFEGGQLPLQKRLPQKRGVGNRIKFPAIAITTAQLNKLLAKSIVDENTLRKEGLIPKSHRKIKIIAGGKLEKVLKVTLPTTKSAKNIIEKAGGTITYEGST
jgi:large subunit ribosomal protein L15